MGFKKWEIPKIDKKIAVNLAEECGVEPFLALMAYSRGYTDPFALDEFLSRDVPEIDPYAFPDMAKAAERVNAAVKSGESIVIYGDYDCDGVTATALLYLFLSEMGATVSYYIPNRHTEGYGMSAEAVRRFADERVGLIITVDNGIAATEEIALASALGIDTVVTDHHLPKESLPAAVAVVDPHRADCFMDFKDFAGVGVAFALALAVSGAATEVMLNKYSDLVALGTVADVMPLKYENRSMVWYGLKKINGNASPGVKALLAAAGARLGEITAGNLAFIASPRINAAGRMGDASRAVEMLICEKFTDAMLIAAELDDENNLRQTVEHKIAAAADEIIIANKLYNNRVIVVAGEDWHEGVLGIAAARIAERYERPAILLTRDGEGELYRGSARTVGNFNIHSAISGCEELLVKFGGHDKAAGLTVSADSLSEFCRAVNLSAAEQDFPVPVLHIDCKLNPAAVLPELVYTLNPLEPYGTENPKPIFALCGMTLRSVTAIGGGKHIRILAAKNDNNIAMVMFNMQKELFPFSVGDLLDFAVTVEIKEYQGQEQLSVFVKDVRSADRNDDEQLSQILLYESYLTGNADAEDSALLCFTREDMAFVYRAVKCGCDTPQKIKLCAKHLLGAKVLVILDVMCELGLISVKGIGDNALIEVLKTEKVDIESSKILQALKAKAVNG